eukprot:363736-Chlamydomonas_euryale.AAC.3
MSGRARIDVRAGEDLGGAQLSRMTERAGKWVVWREGLANSVARTSAVSKFLTNCEMPKSFVGTYWSELNASTARQPSSPACRRGWPRLCEGRGGPGVGGVGNVGVVRSSEAAAVGTCQCAPARALASFILGSVPTPQALKRLSDSA